MKKLLGIAICLIVIFSVNALYAGMKVGVFDMQIVMVKSLNGSKIKDLLQQKKTYYEKQFEKKKNELKKMKNDLEKKSMLLSQEAKDNAEKDYQKKVRDLKLFASDSENELKQLYQEKTQWLIHDILSFVRNYAKKNNFTIVIEKQEGGVVFADKSIDITDKILKAYNETTLNKKK
jgi:outer membrane protein